jgi:hypothetical protein
MRDDIRQQMMYDSMQQQSKLLSEIDDLQRVIEALTVDYNNFKDLYYETEKEKIELLILIKTLKDELGI